MRELELRREIRRRRLIISRIIAENIVDGLSIRTVIAPQGQYPISDGVSYRDALSLSFGGKLRQGPLKLGIEGCLKIWIQFDQNFVRCCRRGGLLGSETGCA